MRGATHDFDGRTEDQRNRVNTQQPGANLLPEKLERSNPIFRGQVWSRLVKETPMARIRIQDENREITDSQEICEFLKPFGIWYEKWDVDGRIGPDATNEEILTAYA